RVPPQAGAVRPLHRGGSQLLPGKGGRDVGEMGDSGRGAVQASGQDAGGAVGEVARSPWVRRAAEVPRSRCLLRAAHSGRAGFPGNGTRPFRVLFVLDTDWTEAWPRAKERAMTLAAVVAFVLPALTPAPPAALAWEPTKPIEFVVPAGTGGGADQ